jgi:hypothetical protein
LPLPERALNTDPNFCVNASNTSFYTFLNFDKAMPENTFPDTMIIVSSGFFFNGQMRNINTGMF